MKFQGKHLDGNVKQAAGTVWLGLGRENRVGDADLEVDSVGVNEISREGNSIPVHMSYSLALMVI